MASYNCMRTKFKILISLYIKDTSITNRFLSSFDRFTVFTTVRGKTSKISLSRDFSAQSITNRVLSSFDRFTVYYNCMRKNFKTSHISVSSVHKYQKSCSQLTRLFFCFSHATVWVKTSEISFPRRFSAQVSQLLFSAHLTVLRFITTVWGKTSKILFLREFSAQVSQMVFSAPLTVLRFSTTVRGETSKFNIYLRSVQKYQKSCFQLT